MSRMEKKLLDEGHAFEFFQVVRLLENYHREAPAVGGSGALENEMVRFRPNSGLGFPPGDVDRMEKTTAPNGRALWRVTQNFMGLYGVNTPLPPHLAEMIAQSYVDDDPLRDFMDIFDHRLISLYYRSWKKHRVAQVMDGRGGDAMTMALCAMLGQAGGMPREDWVVAPERLIRYAGLLAGAARPADGLCALVADYFGLGQQGQVRLTPFLPRRVRLAPGETNRLGAPGQMNRLGDSLVLGESINDLSGQFRLILGPLDFLAFQRLQPGQPAFADLVFLVRLYTRQMIDFELEILLEAGGAETMWLSSDVKLHPLGRFSWIGQPRPEPTPVRLGPSSPPPPQ